MKVIKHTGLVPVRALKRIGNYAPNTVFGMKPKDVLKALKDGFVSLEHIAEDVEHFVVADPAAEIIGAPDDKVEQIADVEIPEDWQKLQWTKQVKLAQEILGEKIEPVDGKKPLEIAQEAITAELARRAAAKAPSEDSDNPDGKTGGSGSTEGGNAPPAGGTGAGGGSATPPQGGEGGQASVPPATT